MSGIQNIGGLATAAGDAYGAYQGGLSTPASQAAFGSAVAAGAATVASTGVLGAFAQGLGIGVSPAAGVASVGLNIGALQNATTPAQQLSAALGIIGGTASAISPFLPPSPQKAALIAIAAAATAAQLAIQNNQPISQALLNILNSAANEFLNLVLPAGMRPSNRGYSNFFGSAKNWAWPRDPIILDLDGNGLETVGLAANIHFDFDADGVLTKTGWAGKDDALLVWDRNANGSIDNGAELFGDFTVLPNGALAPNGFAALTALDANGDGVIDASDPAFHELKLWRDTSQDGISQSGELISLADAGIVSLSLANALKNQRLANGNQLTREGSFTRADGTTSGMGEFKLAADTFDTRFAEPVEVPEALKRLPNMQGAGNVRELQQAATQSGSVAAVLARFQSAPTRTEQKALLDSLITAWADTSGMAGSLDVRAADRFYVEYSAFGSQRRVDHLKIVDGSGAIGAVREGGIRNVDYPLIDDAFKQLIREWSRKIHVLEAFNGQYFFNLPGKKSPTESANWGLRVVSDASACTLTGGYESQPTGYGAQIVRVETSRRWPSGECANEVWRMAA